MKRTLLSALALAVALAGAATAGAGSSPSGVRLTALEGTTFPERAYVLSLGAKTRLSSSEVHVTENGTRVNGLNVSPASLATVRGRAVVLVIDTSNSMRGRPIKGAMAAARALTEQRNATQRLGVVAFNDEATTLLPLTTSQTQIDEALSQTPPLAQGTHIYDAVRYATDLLRAGDTGSGTIVLLSDGADTGSTTTLSEAGTAARSTHVKVYAVGLQSRAYDGQALGNLAQQTGGIHYTANTPEELAPIYAQLGYALANEYVVRYRSLVGPEQNVRVEVAVDGAGTARLGYTTPPLAVPAVPPYDPSGWSNFWESSAAFGFTALFVALMLALATIAVIQPRNRGFRRRMAEFVTLPTEGDANAQRLTTRLFNETEKSLEKTPWWERFKEELEIAEVRMPAVQIVLWTVVGTLAAAWLLWVIGGPLLVIFCPAVPIGVRVYLRGRLERKRAKFLEQLPDNVQVLASALRAGHSLVGALSVVVDDSPEPAKSELRRVIADEQVGVPLEQAMMRVAARMDCRELEQVALVAALGRETGGNTAEVLDRVNDGIRERFALRRLVKTLTAQGRMSRWVVSLLPVFLFIVINLINPDYMQPLFDHPLGRVLLVVSGLMVIAGSFVIKKIVDIKV
jgi:tight adherence protein B